MAEQITKQTEDLKISDAASASANPPLGYVTRSY